LPTCPRVNDIRPAVDGWRRIRRLGLGIVGLMTAGGITVGAALQWEATP